MSCSTISSTANSTRSSTYFIVWVTGSPVLKSLNLSGALLVRYSLYKLNKLSDKQCPCTTPFPVVTLLVSPWSVCTFKSLEATSLLSSLQWLILSSYIVLFRHFNYLNVVQRNSFNLTSDNLEILIIQHLGRPITRLVCILWVYLGLSGCCIANKKFVSVQHNIFISWYYHTHWWHYRQLAVHTTYLAQSVALLWILFELCYMQCMLFSVFAIIMAWRYPNMSTQGTAGKWKHVTLMILQKLEIIGRLESCKNHWGFMTSYSVGSSTIYDIKDELRSFMASTESVKDCFKWQTL